MREFTYGELKQGLLCCVSNKDCKNCPAYVEDDFSCTLQLIGAAFNCINTMEKDLADANKRAEMWEEHAKNLDAALRETVCENLRGKL